MHVRVFLSLSRLRPVPDVRRRAARTRPRTYHVGGLDGWHAPRTVTPRADEGAATASPQGAGPSGASRRASAHLDAVGLGPRSIGRRARSGGEAQRVAHDRARRPLTGTMFVLDEPTVGLHATDIPRLRRRWMISPRGQHRPVIEHDRAVVESSTASSEMGPGAGPRGGKILFDGTPAALASRATPPPAAPGARATRARRSAAPTRVVPHTEGRAREQPPSTR